MQKMLMEFPSEGERRLMKEHSYPEGVRKLLAALNDGEWHRTYDLAPICGIAVHSRVHELRKRYGLNVVHNRRGGSDSAYKLIKEGEKCPGKSN